MSALPWIRRVIRWGVVATTTVTLAASTTAVALADGQAPGAGAPSTDKGSDTVATRVTGTASAEQTIVRPLADTWACSVPGGYTYDRKIRQYNVCSPGNYAYSYHLVAPADNIYACSVPFGYTYDRRISQLNVCSPGNPASSYHLRTPAVGLWACTVPGGWAYDRRISQLNVCSPGNPASSYRLIR